MEQMRLEIVETTRNVKVFSLFVSVVYLCITVKSTEPRWSGRDGPDLLQWFAVNTTDGKMGFFVATLWGCKIVCRGLCVEPLDGMLSPSFSLDSLFVVTMQPHDPKTLRMRNENPTHVPKGSVVNRSGINHPVQQMEKRFRCESPRKTTVSASFP